MAKRHRISNKKIIEALQVNTGFITQAAQSLGVHYTTLRDWIKADEKLQDEIKAINETILDFTESKLHKLIRDENPAAVFFHLKCKGKRRGYIERQEVVTKEDEPISEEFL